VRWSRVALISALLAAALVATAFFAQQRRSLPVQAREQIVHEKQYSPQELEIVRVAYSAADSDGSCAQAYVAGYMSAIRTECERHGVGNTTVGGCSHLTNHFNYPQVLEAALQTCGIAY